MQGQQFEVELRIESARSKNDTIISLYINSQNQLYGIVTGILRSTPDGLAYINQWIHNFSQDDIDEGATSEEKKLSKVSGLISKVITELLLRNSISTWFSDVSTSEKAKNMYKKLSQNPLLEVSIENSPNHSPHLEITVFAVRKKNN